MNDNTISKEELAEMTKEEASRALLWYSSLYSHIADELNVKKVVIHEGSYKGHDGKVGKLEVAFCWDTIKQASDGFKVLKDGKEVDAPKTALVFAQALLSRRA